ncbi:MAG: D-tyrosyl-tRNA(Tyr) deacylase [Chitinophagaceae bacterium]|nr:D-tyrosyl-tRNA(Tyr) deacylase [Chitinophagaceae bacterium]
MKVVIQRVSEAVLSINSNEQSTIGKGLVVLLGLAISDTVSDADWLCKKIISLRIFGDENGLMNKSILEIEGDILLVSQFTLIAAYKKGNRPSFINAARPEQAIPLYEYCIQKLNELLGKTISTGVFGADMQVSLTNDGPVTIVMDSQNKE